MFPEIFFLDFIFHLHLFDRVSLQDSQVFEGIVFSEYSDLVLIWWFYSVSRMSFAIFHYKHGSFFYVKFHSYVFTVYSDYVY